MLNIVVPMAGRGSRFTRAGYNDPKPLIKVQGLEMIRLVISNLMPSCMCRFVFLCLEEHIKHYGVQEKLKAWCPSCEVVCVQTVTEGAACTVLLAERFIDNDDPLMIANSDQWVDYNIDAYLSVMDTLKADGLIMTMKAQDSKWSYIEFAEDGSVKAVREKQPVSDEATVGIYNFRHGRDYVRCAKEMIAAGHRENGEFYVAPVYDYMVMDGKRICICNIGDAMHGLGTPSDLDAFIRTASCRKAVKRAQENTTPVV